MDIGHTSWYICILMGYGPVIQIIQSVLKMKFSLATSMDPDLTFSLATSMDPEIQLVIFKIQCSRCWGSGPPKSIWKLTFLRLVSIHHYKLPTLWRGWGTPSTSPIPSLLLTSYFTTQLLIVSRACLLIYEEMDQHIRNSYSDVCSSPSTLVCCSSFKLLHGLTIQKVTINW